MIHKKRIILTGGGTAGHVWPLLAVAMELMKKPVDLFYVGEKGGVEEALAKSAGISFYGIKTGKWRRYFSLRNLADLFWLKIGFLGSFYLLGRIRPDLVLAKGGFVSLPVVLAAGIKKIPLVIHESDSVLGLVNRLSARWAKKIFVSWPKENFPQK
ncbi:glycosyltransferase, partial [Candidatus Berkelbacteria bacterium]|nr:glycosyltransferase [Candidatus Berkelbacteria bacterium]